MGFTSLVNDPATYNSTLTDLLLQGGAVLYVKTNVPTAMMIAETVNNVFGRTVNPLNRKLTSGGSSGGESALISFGASRIGVGTDIGSDPLYPIASKIANSSFRWLSPYPSRLYRDLHTAAFLRTISELPDSIGTGGSRSREQRQWPHGIDIGGNHILLQDRHRPRTLGQRPEVSSYPVASG